MARHEALHTRIVVVASVPSQEIVPTPDYHLNVLDLSNIASENIEAEARRISQEFFDRRIDVCVDPLFSGLLLRLAETEHIFLLALHHIVGDGASCGIICREIWATYDQLLKTQSLSLPTLPIQFPDYAVWQKHTYEARREKHESYWIDRMKNAPRIDLPVEPATLAQETPVGAVLHLPFGKRLTEKLRETAQREHTLLPIVVLTIYVAALSRWCNQTDFSLPFIYNGRHGRAELLNVVGWLSRWLPMRIEVSDAETLSNLVKRAHLEFASATNHQDFVAPPPPTLSGHFAFNWGGLVTYSARWSIDQQRRANRELRIQPFESEPDNHLQTFQPTFSQTPSGVVLTIRFRRDAFSHSTIKRLEHNLRVIAQNLAEHPLSTIGSLSLAVTRNNVHQ